MTSATAGQSAAAGIGSEADSGAPYRPDPDVFDEMVGPDGVVRPGWGPLMSWFADLDDDGLHRLDRTARRLLEESGVSFNVYADPDDRAHSWRLDPLPVIMTADEWRGVEAGLIQRARLIESVLADVYGPEHLIRSGLVPPGLVYGNPNFLHPCVGWSHRPRRYLQLYACDIARTAAGDWVVLADQTDGPTGNGWTLANRVALSQILGQPFEACGTRRLASHYRMLQTELQARSRSDGRLVLLSQGPGDPSYFSHAYLARYLGYTLVEAADLTVRDARLFLKTLEGLQRVDVVLRKVGSRTLDPLYLPNADGAGVPALIHCAREGGAVFANAIGTGVLQNRVLATLSSALCRHLLDEPLKLPDAPTRWLGAEAADDLPGDWERMPATLRRDPDGRPAADAPAIGSVDGTAIPGRDAHLHVAAEPVALATTPTLVNGRIVPQPWAMRAFVVATEDGFQVLPGGLGRLSPDRKTSLLPGGAGSKDVWVLASEDTVGTPSILTTRLQTAHLRRTGRDLLSRAADNLFWLGRYAERAETTLRILRAVLARQLGDMPHEWNEAVLRALVSLHLRVDEPADGDGEDLRGWLNAAVGRLLFGDSEPFGLRQSLDGLHRTATLSRAQLSQDAWRTLNVLHTDRRWRRPYEPVVAWPTIGLIDSGIRGLAAFAGAAAENMTRNYAWRFLELGRRLERGLEVARAVQALAGTAADPEVPPLRALLELCDSYITYRSRYLITPAATPTLDLLILDETNPRALAYQLAALDDLLETLPHEGPYRSAEHRLVLSLLTALRLADAEALTDADDQGQRTNLTALLGRTVDDLRAASNLISRAFFAVTERSPTTLTLARREPSP